jgi:hypothetical protein
VGHALSHHREKYHGQAMAMSFDAKPEDEILEALQEMQAAAIDLEIREPQTRSRFLGEFQNLGIESYVTEQAELFLATSNKDVFHQILKSNTVKELPLRRERELQRAKQSELDGLGPEVGPEPCASSGCSRLRIALGVFCAEHHLKMLRETRDRISEDENET